MLVDVCTLACGLPSLLGYIILKMTIFRLKMAQKGKKIASSFGQKSLLFCITTYTAMLDKYLGDLV